MGCEMVVRDYDKLALDYGMLLDLRFREGSGLVTKDLALPHHELTLVGPPTWIQVPPANITVLDFLGDYLECSAADTADLDFTTGDYSIACWVNPVDTSTSMNIAGRYALDTDGWEVYFFDLPVNGYLQLRHHHASLAPDNRDGCYSTGWAENIWQLVLITRSGLYPLHYRNGVLLTMAYEAGGVKDPDTANRDLVVGARYTKNGDWYKQYQWGLRIWDRALSLFEAQLMFEMERAQFGV